MTGCTSGGYDQLDISPKTIEQELRPAVCERRQTDRLMENYSTDNRIELFFKSAIDILHIIAYAVSYMMAVRDVMHWRTTFEHCITSMIIQHIY